MQLVGRSVDISADVADHERVTFERADGAVTHGASQVESGTGRLNQAWLRRWLPECPPVAREMASRGPTFRRRPVGGVAWPGESQAGLTMVRLGQASPPPSQG